MQLKIGYLFQCPPWARSFWAFSPYLNHMRNFSNFLDEKTSFKEVFEKSLAIPDYFHYLCN